MERNDVDRVIKQMSVDHQLEIIEIANDPQFEKEEYIGDSFIAGRTIYLGIYQDDERRAISFFHEFGHLSATGESKYEMECNAWKIGVSVAKEYGITFSDEVLAWARHKADTYFGWEWREMDVPIDDKAHFLLNDYSCLIKNRDGAYC